MHELSLCTALVDIVEQQAASHGMRRVVRVEVAIGALSCVAPDALAACFPYVAKETVAAEAALNVQRRDARAWCRNCDMNIALGGWSDPCPRCGGRDLKLKQGDELELIEFEGE